MVRVLLVCLQEYKLPAVTRVRLLPTAHPLSALLAPHRVTSLLCACS